MPLNDVAVRQAKPRDKAWKLADEKGLYLLVQSTGGKLWRLDYRLDGKRKTLALGQYPEVSLAAARKRRDQAREQIAEGTDPSEARKVKKKSRAVAAANSFEAVSREWHQKRSATWTETTKIKNLAMLENDLIPWLGKRAVSEIGALELLVLIPIVRDHSVQFDVTTCSDSS